MKTKFLVNQRPAKGAWRADSQKPKVCKVRLSLPGITRTGSMGLISAVAALQAASGHPRREEVKVGKKIVTGSFEEREAPNNLQHPLPRRAIHLDKPGAHPDQLCQVDPV